MLDEPFGALDAKVRLELRQWLRRFHKEIGVTTILVTHDLREAVYLADKVHVMSNRPGRIVATHEVPIERPRRSETAFEPRFLNIVQSLREQIRAESSATNRPAAARDAS